MRIVFHHRTGFGDAQAIHIQGMVDAFRRQGHSVEIVSVAKRHRRPNANSGTERRRVNRFVFEVLTWLYNIYGYVVLKRAVRRSRADFIYERLAANTLCGSWVSRRTGVPLIVESNGPMYMLGDFRFENIARNIERQVCSNSHTTIAVSQVLADHLVNLGVPKSGIVVMPNGVDPSLFDANLSGAPVREKYRIGCRIVAGFVGWLRDWHGIMELIDAVHEFADIGPDVVFMIIGVGPALDAVKARVSAAGMEDRFIFTGALVHEEIPGHISAMDIALQPSAVEFACPMKIVEYMAMGRCIVAPDQPNIRELLRDGEDSRLFPPDDFGALIKLVAELAKSKSERESLGRRALASAQRQNLTWDHNAKRTVELVGGAKKL